MRVRRGPEAPVRELPSSARKRRACLWVGLVVVGLAAAGTWPYVHTPGFACAKFTRAFLRHDVETLASLTDAGYDPSMGPDGVRGLYGALLKYVPSRGRVTIERQLYSTSMEFIRRVRIKGEDYPVPPTTEEGKNEGGILDMEVMHTDKGWKVVARAVPINWLESLYDEPGRQKGISLYESFRTPGASPTSH